MSESCECSDAPEIGATIKLYCKSCSNVVEKFSVKKPLKAAGIATLLAYGGSQFIDYAVTDNRYPLEVEYAVLEACVSSYSKPIAYKTFGSKRKLCLCALEDTMNEISYVRYKIDEKGFLAAFKDNAKECN